MSNHAKYWYLKKSLCSNLSSSFFYIFSKYPKAFSTLSLASAFDFSFFGLIVIRFFVGVFGVLAF
jgi:hypothetical protein